MCETIKCYKYIKRKHPKKYYTKKIHKIKSQRIFKLETLKKLPSFKGFFGGLGFSLHSYKEKQNNVKQKKKKL